MEKAVTEKNTKNEIFDAYQHVLKEIKEIKKASRKENQETLKLETVQEAMQYTPETIIKGMANIKLEINKFLNEISERITSEYRKLTKIQNAIQIETENLKQKHDIIAEADSLEALLIAQKNKKEAFEKDMQNQRSNFEEEMKERKISWQKEQELFDLKRKETEQQIKKMRQREEEEYNYQIMIDRQRDDDTYNMKKITLEKELTEKQIKLEKEFSDREQQLKSSENELTELRLKVTSFPEQLQTTISETEKRTLEKLEITYRHDAELRAKELEGERKLNQQIISSLENKIKEQIQLIAKLSTEASDASNRVQGVVFKALESAALQRTTSRDKQNEELIPFSKSPGTETR